jgi:hypothetical protein
VREVPSELAHVERVEFGARARQTEAGNVGGGALPEGGEELGAGDGAAAEGEPGLFDHAEPDLFAANQDAVHVEQHRAGEHVAGERKRTGTSGARRVQTFDFDRPPLRSAQAMLRP